MSVEIQLFRLNSWLCKWSPLFRAHVALVQHQRLNNSVDLAMDAFSRVDGTATLSRPSVGGVSAQTALDPGACYKQMLHDTTPLLPLLMVTMPSSGQ